MVDSVLESNDKTFKLELMLLDNVYSSYTNGWWSECLRASIAIHQDYTLRVLNEKVMGIEVGKSGNRYIAYPVFNGERPENGLYHLNIQNSNKMFVGWMNISEAGIGWWGQTGSSDVCCGFIGENGFPETLTPDIPWHEMFNWIPNTPYKDTIKAVDIYEAMKPF